MDTSTATGLETSQSLETLDPHVIRLWRVHALLTTLLSTAATTAGLAHWTSTPASLLAGFGMLGLGTALGLALPSIRYRAWGYRVRERDLLLQRGVLWTTTSIVPHARIQHVDVRTGPLERRFGLARVVVFTAGTTGGALTIPGLSAKIAASLRERLAELGSGDDAL